MRSNARYAVRAMLGPTSICAISIGVALGWWRGDAVDGALLGLVVATTAANVSTTRFVRRQLDRAAARQARERRAVARFDSLPAMNDARRAQYFELRRLADDLDPVAARRLALDDLLDELVRLAVCHQDCVDQLRRSDDLVAIERGRPSSLRADIIARRRRCRDHVLRRADQLAGDVDAIVHWFRFVVQREASVG